MDRDVLFVTLSDISGATGNSIATKETVKAFVRNDNVDLDLICPEPVEELPEVVRDRSRSIRFVTGHRDPTVLDRFTEQVELATEIRSAISARRPDVVVARMNPTLVSPALLAKRYDIPYVLLARGVSHKTLKFSPILERIFSLNARLATQVYAAYQEVKEDADTARTPGQPDAKIFENAVDPALFEPLSRDAARSRIDRDLDPDDFVVGSVSTLKEYHQIDELIHAIASLRAEFHPKLLVVGDGPQRERLEQIVADEGVTDQVVFTGFVPHDEVDTYMSSADILYGSSRPNLAGNSIKCYEYLACERPIIATATPEFEFVAERDFGVTIEETNRDTIAAAIRELYELDEHKRDRMGERGREYVLENHTWQALTEQILEDLD